MGILSGQRIREEIERKVISIDPYPTSFNPASVDLHLGTDVLQYVCPERLTNSIVGLDVRKQPFTMIETIDDEGYILLPGRLYLMHTVESIWTKHYVPVLDGKSSIGRLGIVIHLTAGYGDPGFQGQYTLEVTSMIPVRVFAGMPFCQMRFHDLAGHSWIDYQDVGHYAGPQKGPHASRIWMYFRDKDLPPGTPAPKSMPKTAFVCTSGSVPDEDVFLLSAQNVAKDVVDQWRELKVGEAFYHPDFGRCIFSRLEVREGFGGDAIAMVVFAKRSRDG